MGKIVMSGPQNVSLDGVIQDPDGQEGFRLGGWFVQFGGNDLEEWNQVALDEALHADARPNGGGSASVAHALVREAPGAAPGGGVPSRRETAQRRRAAAGAGAK